MEPSGNDVDSFLSDSFYDFHKSSYDYVKSLYYCHIPVYIPSFNNPTYVVKMIRQLIRHRFRKIIVVDNASDYDKMILVLNKLQHDKICHVIRLGENKGPKYIVKTKEIYDMLPELFCLTDPDIEFSKSLPADFMTQLTLLSDHFRIGKVGFALSLKNKDKMKQARFINASQAGPTHIWEWESQFWRYKLGHLPDGSEVFDAPIDTTFALYNKKYFNPDQFFHAVRVSGNYESEHTPWYEETTVPEEEEVMYRKTEKYSKYSSVCP